MNSNQLIRIGLIGLGRMGQNHLRVLSLLKGVEIAFISDINIEIARRLGEQYNAPIENIEELSLSDLDGVIICTPTITHDSYIRLVANRVSNIFVEKPIASTLNETEKLVEFVQKNNLNLQVGFIERFNPAIQSLKKILEKSECVISLDFTRTNKLSSRITDVDVITDLMIHDIDLALFLNGPAISVTAHGFASIEMTDFASALIKHSNGRFSRIQASRITEKKMRLIEATCLEMYIHCDLLRKEILISRQTETTQAEGQAYIISGIQEAIEVRPQEALLFEMQAFVNNCRSKSKISVPNEDDGLAAMRICEQIHLII